MDNSEDVQITSHYCVYIALLLPRPKKETCCNKENNINACVTEDLCSLTVSHTTKLDAMLNDTLRKICTRSNIQNNTFNDGGTAP
jgi:hypothetical protein